MARFPGVPESPIAANETQVPTQTLAAVVEQERSVEGSCAYSEFFCSSEQSPGGFLSEQDYAEGKISLGSSSSSNCLAPPPLVTPFASGDPSREPSTAVADSTESVSKGASRWVWEPHGLPTKQSGRILAHTPADVREPIFIDEGIGTFESLDVTWRNRAKCLAESHYFQMAIASIIILNTVYIGIETDHMDMLPQTARHIVEGIFLSIFVFEISLRLASGWDFICGTSWDVGWNVFDLVLVMVTLLDLFIISVFFSNKAEDLEAWAVVRVLRLLRVARIFRLLQYFHELWLMVAGVVDAMWTLIWAWVLIVMILYSFGVFLTGSLGPFQTVVTCEGLPGTKLEDLFGSIHISMFTLFSMMTMNNWGDIARCTMQVESWTWIVFVLFFLCTSFGMLNMVVAVTVEGTLERAMKQRNEGLAKSETERREAIAQVVDIFSFSDTNGDGHVTRKEFLSALTHTDVMRKLLEIGIDIRKAKNLFDILDYDSSGSLDLREFVHGMMRARGTAQAKDVLALQCDVLRSHQRQLEDLLECRDHFSLRLDSVDAELDDLHIEVRRMLRTFHACTAAHDGEDAEC